MVVAPKIRDLEKAQKCIRDYKDKHQKMAREFVLVRLCDIPFWSSIIVEICSVILQTVLTFEYNFNRKHVTSSRTPSDNLSNYSPHYHFPSMSLSHQPVYKQKRSEPSKRLPEQRLKISDMQKENLNCSSLIFQKIDSIHAQWDGSLVTSFSCDSTKTKLKYCETRECLRILIYFKSE